MFLPDDTSEKKIKSTAKELESLNFTPILLIETPDFLYLTKAEILNEVYRVLCLPDEELPDYDRKSFKSAEDFREKQLSLLYFYYELLGRLRLDEPEAWDYIHELYEDD